MRKHMVVGEQLISGSAYRSALRQSAEVSLNAMSVNAKWTLQSSRHIESTSRERIPWGEVKDDSRYCGETHCPDPDLRSQWRTEKYRCLTS
jgi:hypothetical protein